MLKRKKMEQEKRTPNKKTIQVMKEIEEGKNLIECDSSEELMKKLEE